jgi:hypothetical protein
MLIRNLVPWVGDRFEYNPGDVVEVPDSVGRDRIAAGIAVEDDGAPRAQPVHQLPPAASTEQDDKARGKRGGK